VQHRRSGPPGTALIAVAAAVPASGRGRLIKAALGLASWRYSLRALAAAYPQVVVRAAPMLAGDAADRLRPGTS
jgi:hypothetical protein